jgi:DNA repair and recombination protein RAD52
MTTPHRGFSPEQIAELAKPLDPAHVLTRDNSPQPRQTAFDYISGWHANNEANRIFGFDGWDRELRELSITCERERPGDKTGWIVGYRATVRVYVHLPDGSQVYRDGSGHGEGIDTYPTKAHEKALKEAETDAMKRALSTFGNQFGLALYDKEQRNVAAPPPSQPMIEEVEQICQVAGFTKSGIEVFAARLSGKASGSLWDVPTETLRQLADAGSRGISPQTVAQCNGTAEAPTEPTEPPSLVSEALAVCRAAGFTDLGIAAFADRLTQGCGENLGDVPAELLHRLVKGGHRAISPETIAQCNGDKS